MRRKDRYIWLGILLVDLFLVLINQNTYDSGDSILHYLHSNAAFKHPEHFLGHWSKPLFVALSAPFSFWGWKGMQLFNAMCIFGSSFFCWKLFKSYGLRSWLAPLFCLGAPSYFLVQSSGLTEPLFAFLLILIVWLLRSGQWTLPVILLSFLPFARSEGWIVAVVIAVYLLHQRKFRTLPFLLVGWLFYSTLGLLFKGDFLWLIHENSYMGAEAKYGHGSALHFVEQLPYIIGFPLYFLLFIGLFDGYWRAIKGQMDWLEFFLIYGIFLAYLLAHSIFWANGWFHSLGMNRVLIAIVPLAAFIAYRGLERLMCAIYFVPSIWVFRIAVTLVALFPFTANKAALDLPESMAQLPEQTLIDHVVEYTDSLVGNKRVYYANPYVPMAYGLDLDDPDEALTIGLVNAYGVEPGSLVIWDSYFSVTDQAVQLHQLQSREDIEHLRSFTCSDCDGHYKVEVFASRP